MKPAVCSWSLQPASPVELASRVKACGLSRVQLALGPSCETSPGLWAVEEVRRVFATECIEIVSGMLAAVGEDYASLETIKCTGGFLPDQHWTTNKQLAMSHAAVAAQLGLKLVTTHVGFLPHDVSLPADRALRERMIDRISQVATIFASHGIDLALETGQEAAPTLVEILKELDQRHAGSTLGVKVGVNFDPANMILYGMGEPVASLLALAPWVKQIHIKDATPNSNPELNGGWGTEVPAGTGAVDWPRFFQVVKEKLTHVNLVIEREAGDNRVADVQTAARLIAQMM